MSIETQAWVLSGPGEAELESRALPELADDEVLVGDLVSGVCGTDVAKWSGEEAVGEPTWLGHEFGGRVERVGSAVTNVTVGQSVAAWVRPGWPFAGLGERTVVPAAHVVPVSQRELAWAVEPLMCVVNALIETHPRVGPLAFPSPHPLWRFGYRPRDRRHIAVIGTGTMALFAVALSALEDPLSLTVVGRSDSGLERAERLGATRTINTTGRTEALVIDQVRRDTPNGRGVDLALEGIGLQLALDRAFRVLRMGGTVSALGFHQAEGGVRTVGMAEHMGWEAKHLLSGHGRDAETALLPPEEDRIIPAFRLAAELINGGTIDPTVLLERTWPLAGGRDALAAAAARGSGKQVVDATA